MMSRLPLWLALRIVRVVAALVPEASRANWTREWDAELRYRSAQLQRRRTRSLSTNVDLIRHALGSVSDAAWIRRQFTLDADAVHDLVHGVRMLLKAPGFTAIALLVFAVGIGATTAIVSVADALFMRPLPVRQPERVVTVWQYNRDTGASQQDVASANGIDWMTRARSFETVAMAEPFSIVSGRDPGFLTAARVGEGFFNVLGTSMVHGRAFLPEEHRRGAGRFAIFSYSMWRDRFGSDASIVGQSVHLNDAEAFTVVGVMPPDFELRLFEDRRKAPEPSVWLPKQGLEPFEPTNRRLAFWNIVGRLRPRVSVDAARAELDAISSQLAREYPQTNHNIAAQVVPLRDHLVGSLHDVLPLLLGSVAILLIVACANVAVRRAAGAGRKPRPARPADAG